MTAPTYGYLHSATVHSVDAHGGIYLDKLVLSPTARRGPVPTCVTGLQAGDRVVVASLGTSRDVILIVGRVGGLLPRNLPELAALLDAKADAADLVDLDGVVGGHTAALDALTDRADAVDTALDTQGDALDAQALTLASHTTTLGTNTTTISDHEARTVRLEQNPVRQDRDLFSDLLSNMPRHNATNSVDLVNGTLYVYRFTPRTVFAVNQIRMATSVAGSGGTGNVGLYYMTASGTSFALMRSGTISLSVLGRVTHTLSSTYITETASQLLVALLPLAYTGAASLAGRTGVMHSSLLNPSPSLATAVSKTGQSALPASITLTDGTWTQTATSLPWVSLG